MIVKLKQIKCLENIQRHFDFVYELDRKNRNKHGLNQRLVVIQKELQELKSLMIGEGCDFFQKEKGWCSLLNDCCDVINKVDCPVKMEHLKEKENEKKINSLLDSVIGLTKRGD